VAQSRGQDCARRRIGRQHEHPEYASRDTAFRLAFACALVSDSRWARSHLDANANMRNSAYLDVAASARLMYFASGAFD
jgi:hypothetical protein